MKIDVTKEGDLHISLSSLVDALSEDALRVFAQSAVFQECLLRGVVDALAKGEMFGDAEEQPWWYGGDTFTELRLKLTALMPEVAAQAVIHLEREMRQARAERDAYRSALWRLSREWDERERERSDVERGNYRSMPYVRHMERAEVDAYLAGRGLAPTDAGSP